MTRLGHLFPDRRSYVLWFLALAWMVAIGYHGWTFMRMGVGARGAIFGGIFLVFSPLPVALLLTREVPDKARRREQLDRQARRLAQRVDRDEGSDQSHQSESH
jgi:hypothetical protein